MSLLGRREYGRRELKAKLQEKGCSADVAVSVASALEAEGLLSDQRFAEALVNARRRRGQGPVRIEHELREKGVEPELVSQALSAAGDWIDELRRLRAKKFGVALPETVHARAKQVRFLQSRGFALDQILKVMNSHDSD